MQPEPGGDEQHERRQMQHAGAGERAALAEPRRPGVQALLAVDVGVEERVEEVEAGDPRARRRLRAPRPATAARP